MRSLIAALLLVFISGSALAQEPVMQHRFGPGPHFLDAQPFAKQHKAKPSKGWAKHRRREKAEARRAAPQQAPQTHERVAAYAGSLVEKARSYIGTNPTGKSSLWCGRFMAMIAPEAARKVKNPDWARDWADLPKTYPHVGAIAVLSRGRRGGHVGVVTGIDRNGNPIIVSGNHGRRVGEGTYPRSRVIAWVAAS